MTCEQDGPNPDADDKGSAQPGLEPDLIAKLDGLSPVDGMEAEKSCVPASRNEPLKEYKKRKRDDLGLVEFEALMGGGGDQTLAQEREEPDPAVVVGLKPDVLSPSERVRFKDFLKRKSRAGEYLECRNTILKLWTKDVQRLLRVTDCGVCSAAQPNEPPRAALIREIHEFLDYHGYINFGVVKRIKAEVENGQQNEPPVVEETVADVDGSGDGSDGPRKAHGKRKEVIVVGAGPAGLVAARHLQRMNFSVTVLEARERVGGRVYTDRSTFSVPVDLGASIITGTLADSERRADPSALLCRQLGLEMTSVRHDCPLYDSVSGERVPSDLDTALEEKLNTLLDDTIALVAQSGGEALRMSLDEGLEQVLLKRKASRNGANVDQISELTMLEESPDLERRIMDWHFANLEYGCAAELDKVSLAYWNQDDSYGGFAGPHCMIKGGYDTLMDALAQGLDVKLGKVVTEVSYTAKDVHVKTGKKKQVRLKTEDGDNYSCDAVLLTVPLGCLKAQSIRFVPQLPAWKSGCIDRLGFGTLTKVVLEFDTVFWDETVDIFGVAGEDTESRGKCFMFWNLLKTAGAPVLIALAVGKAARTDGPSLVAHAVDILRRLHGRTRVPEPVASKVTDWASDPYSRGAYSSVAVGASGEDYDILGRPVEDCVFFAGEATCKEHPDTVGGAILSGMKQAVRILDILENRGDLVEEAEEMDAAHRQPDRDRNEVRDMQIRIQAAEYACNKQREGNLLDAGEEPISRDDVLKDMFKNAKTAAGRLFVAKEVVGLSAAAVKAFAGTKAGLSTINLWMLDSMGKDGTQLLRVCIRLLLAVATDMLAVRQSGIGKTVKEKVHQHTSRDIRALAGQLVAMWFELYRREKSMLNYYRKNVKKDDESLGTSSAPACSSSQREHSQGTAEQATSRHEQKSGATSSEGPPEFESGENEVGVSELEAAALAEAEAYQAAALAAAEAYATAEAERCALPNLPKILSFHKFAKREKVDDYRRRRLPEAHRTPRGHSLAGSDGLRRVSSLEITGSCSNASSPNVNGGVGCDLRPGPEQLGGGAELMVAAGEDSRPVPSEENSDRTRSDRENRRTSSAATRDRSTPEQIKKALTDYVVHLLTPLYKTRRIQKDAFKMIAKKTTMKVMERDGVRDTDVSVSDYLNSKRKHKIRDLVDKFVEKHLAETAKQSAGPPGS